MFFKACALFILFYLNLSDSYGCKPSQDSTWKWSEEKALELTKSIWVGEVVSKNVITNIAQDLDLITYEFSIIKVIQGKELKVGTKLFRGPLLSSKDLPTVSYGKDCKLIVNLDLGGKYIVMDEIFSPFAFKKITEK